VLNDVAEVRKAKESAASFVDAPSEEQAAWMEDLRRRTRLPLSNAPAVCLLDTGVNRSHPLIEGVLSPDDAMTVDPSWGANDEAASRLWWKYKKGVFSRYPKTITGSWRESDRGGIRLWGKVYHLLTKWKLF
jgi:hypothetical protein